MAAPTASSSLPESPPSTENRVLITSRINPHTRMRSPPLERISIPKDDKRNVVIILGGGVIALSTAMWLKIRNRDLVVHVIDPDEYPHTCKTFPRCREPYMLYADIFPGELAGLVQASLQLHDGFLKHEDYVNPGKVLSETVWYQFGVLLSFEMNGTELLCKTSPQFHRIIPSESLYGALERRCKSYGVIFHRSATAEIISEDTMRVSYPRSLKRSIEIQCTKYLLAPSSDSWEEMDPIPKLREFGFITEKHKDIRSPEESPESNPVLQTRQQRGLKPGSHGKVSVREPMDWPEIALDFRLIAPMYQRVRLVPPITALALPVLDEVTKHVMAVDDDTSLPISPGGGVWFASPMGHWEHPLSAAAGLVLAKMIERVGPALKQDLGLEWC